MSRRAGIVRPWSPACPVDGKPVPWRGHHWATYCSTRCRVAAWRARQRAGAAGDPPGTVTAGTSPAGEAIEGGQR